MQSRPSPLYDLLDANYHEGFDRYTPQRADFHELVSSLLPEGWAIVRQGIWFYASSASNALPAQGWKIHLSATPANAREVLQRAMSVLFRRGKANFKFALDHRTLALLNGKNWPRAASGKFITIYPPDNSSFLALIEELRLETAGLRGPYILSDRQHKESGIVFYRYGGMQLRQRINIKAERVPMLVDPDGNEIPDLRLPYPTVPEWASDVLSSEETQSEGHTLGHGRYLVEDAFGFSSAGGVYRAQDIETGRYVVIKEARPFITAGGDQCDAVDLLKKEYRLLERLQDTGIAPRPIQLFQEWEHWFLVEELIDGVSMASHSAAHSVLLRTRPTPEAFKEWHDNFRKLCASLARIIDVLHQRNIVFGDLSTGNLIVVKGRHELKLIDFEGAYELGVDESVSLFTPGFASRERMSGKQATFFDDYYGMGAVILAYLLPLNGLFQLNAAARGEAIKSVAQDIGLPDEIVKMILDLVNPDPRKRPTPASVIEIVENARSRSGELPGDDGKTTEDYAEVISGIVKHLHGVAALDRQDRLFPSDCKVFTTNPLSLAYGATGVAYALQRVDGAVPQAILDWILAHDINPNLYPPGLYLGLSGSASVLWELDANEEAERVFRMSLSHPLLHAAPDIFYGISGWGMTSLKFFMGTGNELYLDKARAAGDYLLEVSRSARGGRCWEVLTEGKIGFAHGASGIGLFLLYLYLATNDESYLQAGRRGLDFDLAQGRETKDGGISFPSAAGLSSTLYPYWQSGSAGVGSALLRFYRLTGEASYRTVLEKIFIDVDRKYAVTPGRFRGLAGLGDFLLDMYEFNGETRYLKSAEKVARGIMLFRTERNGVAFPGDFLARLCCDFGTGSAGIALFLNRLIGRQGSDFMLDELFEKTASEANVLHSSQACSRF